MSFLKDSAKMLVLRAVTIAIGAVTAIILARWLGPSDRGELAVLILSVGLAAVVLQLGIPEALIYFIGAKEYPQRNVVTTTMAYCLVVGLVTGGVGLAVLMLGFDFTAPVAGLLVGATMTTLLLSTGRHVLLGQKRFVAYSLSTVIEVAIYLAGAVALYLADSMTVESVLGAHVLSLVATTAIVLGLLRSAGALSLSPALVEVKIIVACVKRGFHLFLVGLGGFGVQRINYFALEAFASSHVVGLFTAANTVPRLVANLPQQLAITLYSYVSNRVSKEEGTAVTTAIASLLAVLFTLMIFPLWLLAEPLVNLLFGAEFAGIGWVMVILTVSMMFSGLGSLLFNSLAGAGQHQYGTKMTILNLTVLTVMVLALIPPYGLEGAAWAQLFANLVNLVYIAAVFCRFSGASPLSLVVPSPKALGPLLSLRPGGGAKAAPDDTPGSD